MKYFFTFLLLFSYSYLFSQQETNTVITQDIDNFWRAYDSVKSSDDPVIQTSFLQKIYIDQGTDGLKAFMQLRNFDAQVLLKSIKAYPKFWSSIRLNTEKAKFKACEIEQQLNAFKELYPKMKPVKIYFTIGFLKTGGTIMNDMVLIGTEIGAADSNTISLELNNWLQSTFKSQGQENLVGLNIHEAVHTQQKGSSFILLNQCIYEGACDFIREKVTGKNLNTNYVKYGRIHLNELKEKFRNNMYSDNFTNWLYDGTETEIADLGYFIGYKICDGYYNHCRNKKKAIREIIELDYNNQISVNRFLKKSGFFKEREADNKADRKTKQKSNAFTAFNVKQN